MEIPTESPQCVRCSTPVAPDAPLFRSHLCPCTYHSQCFIEQIKQYISGHWIQCPTYCACGVVIYHCQSALPIDEAPAGDTATPTTPSANLAQAQQQPTFSKDKKAMRQRYTTRNKAKAQLRKMIQQRSREFKEATKPIIQQIRDMRKAAKQDLRQSDPYKEFMRASRAASVQEMMFRKKYSLGHRSLRQLFPQCGGRRSTLLTYILRRAFRWLRV